MRRITSLRVSLLSIPAILAATLSAAPATARDDVFVVNFPRVQEVSGSVTLSGPTPQGALVRFGEVVVAPVPREETTALVRGGVLESDGFVSVVLSLTGQVRADTYRPGQIGAVLIPAEEPMQIAFQEAGQLLFPLEVQASASPAGGLYFSTEPHAQPLAFPRYRIYFFNTTDRPATVTLFAYLTN
jgi:hypothetical protein